MITGEEDYACGGLEYVNGGGKDDAHNDCEGGLIRCLGVNLEEINRFILGRSQDDFLMMVMASVMDDDVMMLVN